MIEVHFGVRDVMFYISMVVAFSIAIYVIDEVVREAAAAETREAIRSEVMRLDMLLREMESTNGRRTAGTVNAS